MSTSDDMSFAGEAVTDQRPPRLWPQAPIRTKARLGTDFAIIAEECQ